MEEVATLCKDCNYTLTGSRLFKQTFKLTLELSQVLGFLPSVFCLLPRQSIKHYPSQLIVIHDIPVKKKSGRMNSDVHRSSGSWASALGPGAGMWLDIGTVVKLL